MYRIRVLKEQKKVGDVEENHDGQRDDHERSIVLQEHISTSAQDDAESVQLVRELDEVRDPLDEQRAVVERGEHGGEREQSAQQPEEHEAESCHSPVEASERHHHVERIGR